MSNGTYQCTICGKTGDDEVPACEHSPGHIHYDSGWLVPEKEVENLRAELAAAKAALASVLKLIDDSDLVRNTDNDGNFMGFFEQGVRITNALAEAKRILEGKD